MRALQDIYKTTRPNTQSDQPSYVTVIDWSRPLCCVILSRLLLLQRYRAFKTAMSRSDGHNENEARADVERQVVNRLRSIPSEREEIAHRLFADHFGALEVMIKRRLCYHGLPYHPGADHYNDVFDAVVSDVYAPSSIVKSVSSFDPDKGTLRSWLLTRAEYAVRSWIKSHKSIPANQAVAAEVEDLSSERHEWESRDSLLEAALQEMSHPQRAAVVLRALPSRQLTDADLEAISRVTGRGVDQIRQSMATALSSVTGDEAGLRAEAKAAKIALCHDQLSHHQRLKDYYRTSLIQNGHSSDTLDRIEIDYTDKTQEEIKSVFADEDKVPIRRFAMACHEAERLRSQLSGLTSEYYGIPNAALLSTAKVASLLGKTEGAVTAALHRAKAIIENVQNRGEMSTRSGLTD